MYLEVLAGESLLNLCEKPYVKNGKIEMGSTVVEEFIPDDPKWFCFCGRIHVSQGSLLLSVCWLSCSVIAIVVTATLFAQQIDSQTTAMFVVSMVLSCYSTAITAFLARAVVKEDTESVLGCFIAMILLLAVYVLLVTAWLCILAKNLIQLGNISTNEALDSRVSEEKDFDKRRNEAVFQILKFSVFLIVGIISCAVVHQYYYFLMSKESWEQQRDSLEDCSSSRENDS